MRITVALLTILVVMSSQPFAKEITVEANQTAAEVIALSLVISHKENLGWPENTCMLETTINETVTCVIKYIPETGMFVFPKGFLIKIDERK